MQYINEYLRKKKPETFMDYNPGEIPKKKETTTKPLTLGEVAPKATERVTSRQTSDFVQTRDPFLKGFYSTEDKPETERKNYLQHRGTPSLQTKTAETPIRKTQNSNPYGSPVKIVGDNITEKDYEDFWNAFRNEGKGNRLNWAANQIQTQSKPQSQSTPRRTNAQNMMQWAMNSGKNLAPARNIAGRRYITD